MTLNIYLADVQNTYYKLIRNSAPLGMGYVAAYLDKLYGKDVNVRMFRKFEELHDAFKEQTAHIVAFGSYSWNSRLTLQAAQYIRTAYPDTVIAIGGPDVSLSTQVTEVDLRANRQIDFYMPDEGEQRFSNLVAAYMETPDRKQILGAMIEGCMSLNQETDELAGTPGLRTPDINDIPSPILNGMLDRFISDPDYLPIIQTSRGCPYGCTFCVSGKDTWRKVKAFDLDRVFDEIDYVSTRSQNAYLRFADENFGILRRDVDIAKHILKVREHNGFPSSVSIYTDKHPTDRVKEISLLLRELLPFNISYQTTTHDVLQNIKRINLKDTVVMEAVKFARENDLLPVSEMIFALPGESATSFLEAVDKLVGLRFESIGVNQLRILKGTEMDLPEDRERWDVRTKFTVSENGYTVHEALENVEIDEFVVSNNTLSEADYFQLSRFIWLFKLTHYLSYLKELLFVFDTRGVTTSTLLMGVIENRELCPILTARADKFELGMRDFFKDTPEEVVESLRQRIEDGDDEPPGLYVIEFSLVIDILKNDLLGEVVDEVIKVGSDIYKSRNGSLPDDMLEELAAIKVVLLNSFIPVHRRVNEFVDIQLPFDVLEWRDDNFMQPLSTYRLDKVRSFTMQVPNIENYERYWDDETRSLEMKYQRYMVAINSAGRRRFFVRKVDPSQIEASAQENRPSLPA